MRLSHLKIVSICLLSLLQLNAQVKSEGKVHGIVLDSLTNAPMEFTNVGLYNAADTTLVGGTVSDNEGSFIIENIPAGSYYLQVSFVGYKTQTIENLSVTTENPDVNLGEIILAKDPIQLGTVEKIEEKPEVEFQLDKKVINVDKTLYSTSGTALDVLQNQPSVQTDSDGNITLRGSADFTLQMNGRPSVLQGSDGLRQIPANIISSIEIITNPSAKYQAEGSAGIINIITKKIEESSLSGIVNAGLGSRDKYNTESTLSYRDEDYTLSGGFDYSKQNRIVDQTLDRETYLVDGTLYNNTKIGGGVIRNNYALRGGIDYDLTEQSGISVNGVLGKVDVVRAFDFSTGTLSDSSEEYIFSDDNYEINVDYINASVYYNNKFIPDVNELVIEGSYTNLSLPSIENTSEYISDVNFQLRSLNPGMREFNDNTKRNNGQVKANYVQNFEDKSKLETGVQADFYFRNFDVLNKIFNYDINDWEITPDITNQFDYKNNVYAAFITYTNSIFDFNYQLGLRSEYTDRLLEQKTLGTNFKYDKVDLFPTLSISRGLGAGQQIQFSYSRRINRPYEQFLNPYPNYKDSYLNSVGNPELLPEFTHSLELNYQYYIQGLFLSVQTYMRLESNSITQTMRADDEGVLNLTFDNLADTRTEGAEISASISAIPWLRLDPSVNLYNSNLNGYVIDEYIDKSSFTYSLRLIGTIMFDADTKLQLISNYFSKQLTTQGEIKPFVILSANLRKDFFDKKLSVTIQARNLFKTFKYDVDNRGDNFKTLAFVRPESPVFYLTLSYTFNNYKPTSRQPEDVDINVNEGL